MATAFRIHEDIDNVLDLNKENNLIGMKNNGNDKEKRPTLAVLNNITFDGRAHASKTVSVKITFVKTRLFMKKEAHSTSIKLPYY